MDTTVLKTNLFIGKEELNNIISNQSGYSKNIIKSLFNQYGLIDYANDATNFQIVQGSDINHITLKAGLAFDSNLNMIYQSSDYIDISTVPADSTDYYVIMSGAQSYYEKGTVSISITGQVTGIGTQFTRFRGGDYALRLKFPTSASNLLEYEISSITSDTVLQLIGTDFTAESGLTYQIYGAFPPSLVIADKKIFSYIYPSLELNVSSSITANVEFILAKVKNTGAALTITDLRSSYYVSYNNIYTKDEVIAVINKLVVGYSTNIQWNASLYLEISKLDTIFNINGSGDTVSDIKYDDASTVETGKILIINVGSSGYVFNINSGVGSNIVYLPNTAITSLTVTSDTIILTKTDTKWYMLTGLGNVIDSDTFHAVTSYTDVNLSSYSTVSKMTLSYRKTPHNTLMISGYFQTSVSYSGYLTPISVTTLPVGYRPSYDQFINVYDMDTGTLIKASVLVDGTITLIPPITASSYLYVNDIIPLN